MAAGKEKTEVYLWGGVVKVGEKFCFPSLKYLDSDEARNTKYMIDRIGSGPFVLLKVMYFPRDGHPLYMLYFINSKGKEVDITSGYFVKYIEKDAGESIKPCEEGCKECQEDKENFQKLIHDLSAIHMASYTDPEYLCSASTKEFDQNHPNFSKFPQMQGELFDIASRHQLAWTS